MTQPNQTQNALPEESASKHDIAGNTAKSYINSPITPLFIIVGFVIGIMGILFTPRQEDPQISVPMVDVMVQYPGASNKQVEALVSEPLERLFKEIKGVEHVYSASDRGQSIITVQFLVGENMEDALVNVYNKMASNLDHMPEGVLQPVIKPKGADEVPVVTFTLSSKTLESTQLRLLGFDVLQAIASIDHAAQGFVVGGDPTEIKVEIDPEKIAGYGISLTQIGQAIRAANAESSAGELSAWQQKYLVYTGDFLTSADDINDLIVGVKDKAPVFVRDVATVTEGAKDATNLVRFYTGPANKSTYVAPEGENAITVALAKQPGANGVSVANDAISRLTELKGTLIPDDVHIAITRNYGKTANDKVNELIFKLFIATGSVTLLIWFFLGWRAAAVVAIVIPIVILSTVFAAWMMGLTIDRVSLFALIFSIGILVDDAVVVLENIYRRWLMDSDTGVNVTVDAVSEVGNPTIIATFAVIAALMPMAFVSGMMGPYMAPIPALGSVAMVISLFAAFAFTPWLAQRMKPKMESLKAAEEKEHEQSERLGRFFEKLLGSLLVEKVKGWGLLLAIITAFALAVYLVYSTMVPVKLLPYDNKPDFSVVINFPEGTDLTITANLTHKLAKTLQEEVPEITTMETYVGTPAPFDFNGLVRHYYLRNFVWNSDIQVHLSDKSERHRSSHQVAESIRAKLTEIAHQAGAKVQIVEMPPGPPVLQSIVAEIYGPDEATRNATAEKVTQIFEQAEMVVDVDNFITEPHDTWRFVIDKQKAMESGISVSTINQTVEMAMGGFKLGDVKQGFKRGEPTFIVLQAPQMVRAEFARIGQIPVQSELGILVPLNELGRFIIERQQTVLYHKDLTPVQYVTATGQGRLGAPIYGMLDIQELMDQSPELNGLNSNFVFVPNGLTEVGMMWAGEWTVTYQTFRDMGLAFGVALLIIYMLVVWEFRNFLIPLIVMAPIPLTIIGIAPGHWIMGAEFTATSMIGFIALAGIIVRNSILLVDFSRQEIAKGVAITDAVIFACKARTRPIIITAAALVLGSSVILFDPIFQGMAISLIFGILVATLLTLVVIPLGCVSGRAAFCASPSNYTAEMGAHVCGLKTPEIEEATIHPRMKLVFAKTAIDPFNPMAMVKQAPKAVALAEESFDEPKKAAVVVKKVEVTETPQVIAEPETPAAEPEMKVEEPEVVAEESKAVVEEPKVVKKPAVRRTRKPAAPKKGATPEASVTEEAPAVKTPAATETAPKTSEPEVQQSAPVEPVAPRGRKKRGIQLKDLNEDEK
ncbi:efflux RND transporter permease subunit [Thiosulfativibrio zosterae]|uniref:Multidrug transporter AcrB n=1 Tax=Thiosulfativibrio zosterae TaxID=2675053 RepID=A0A6F8PR79_9GAMM|nr:efflux RND transporter permease subunit [Thiosulfativibrio zosterae]BBP44619.1 multidrug transporter AcrB [Thiosulfativibrio zosterae]